MDSIALLALCPGKKRVGKESENKRLQLSALEYHLPVQHFGSLFIDHYDTIMFLYFYNANRLLLSSF